MPGLFEVRTRGAHTYIADDADALTLIDAGAPGSGPRIMDAIAELGRHPEQVRTILVTHGHIDHVGGLPEVQHLVPGRTGVHVAEACHLEARAPLPNPFANPWLARLSDPLFAIGDPGRARVDLYLRHGDELPVLGGLRIIHTPGHTAGSVAFHFPERGALIVGDAMQFRFGRLMLPNRLFSADLDQAAASVRKLSGLQFDTLCFSHFRPLMDSASDRVRAFAATLDG